MKIYRAVVPLLGMFALLFAPAATVCAQTQMDAPMDFLSEMGLDNIDPEELNKLQAVLSDGYETFKAHKAAKALTNTDKKIQQLLEVTFPALDQRVQKQAQLMEQEYNRLLEKAVRDAGEFTTEKYAQAQQSAAQQLQAQYEERQAENEQAISAAAAQLAEALIANQNKYPNYQPANPELAQMLALSIYSLYTLENMSPEEQENMMMQMFGM